MSFFIDWPGFVNNVRISYPSSTSLSLSWDSPDDLCQTNDPYRYEIKYQLQQIGSCNPNHGPLMTHTSNSNRTTMEVCDLEPFSNYSFQFRSIVNGHYGRPYDISFRTRETGKMTCCMYFLSASISLLLLLLLLYFVN